MNGIQNIAIHHVLILSYIILKNKSALIKMYSNPELNPIKLLGAYLGTLLYYLDLSWRLNKRLKVTFKS